MALILVVDDEAHIVDVVRAYLARDGHEVATAFDGDEALRLAAERSPDLVVLDVMLPGRSGFEVLRELRARGRATPVIMLTARDDVIDRVAGLETGADDYVTKPFEPRELVARVSAVLRRSTGPAGGTGASAVAGSSAGGGAGPSSEGVGLGGATAGTGTGTGPTAAPLAFFDLTIDLAAREVSRGDQSLALTRAELDLLATLARRPGQVLTREQLGEALFGESFAAYDRTIDSHVKNLRRKLGARPDGEPYVETVRGVGYRGART